jgi:hypothetical protein
MNEYPIIFNFRDHNYSATLTIIFPQYHCWIKDEALQKEYGELHIIIWNEKTRQYGFGLPKNSTDGRDFIGSLVGAVHLFLKENNMAP